MEDKSEKCVQSTEQSDDDPRSGYQQGKDLQDDTPVEWGSLKIPEEENTQSCDTKEVRSMDMAGPSGITSKTEFSKETSKERLNNSDSEKDLSSSTRVEYLTSSEKSLEIDWKKQEPVDNTQATFYYLHDSSSDDDSDLEKAVRPFRVCKGQRTFSECDSPDDSGLDFKIYDSEAKSKKKSKDVAKNLKKVLGTTKSSNTTETPTESTSFNKDLKSGGAIPKTKCEKSKLSCRKNENKPKKFQSTKTSKIFKSKTKSKKVSTRVKNIPDATIDIESTEKTGNIEHRKSSRSDKILSGEVSNKIKLSTIKTESPDSTDKAICLLSKTSDDVTTPEETTLALDSTSKEHVGQTTCIIEQLKSEGSQINPLDNATGSDAPKNALSDIKPTQESIDTHKDYAKSKSVNDDLVCETTSISDCAKVPLSQQQEKLNSPGKSNIDLTEDNLETSCSIDIEKSKLASDSPPAIFKVPTIRRVPKSRSKSEKHPSSTMSLNAGASTSLSPKRPTDLNVGQRSEYYSFFAGQDENNILRPYRSLPNVYSAPRKSENRRSVNLDTVRSAVRALFTGDPHHCRSTIRESGNLSHIGLLSEGTPPTKEFPQSNPFKTSDKTRAENDIKEEAKKLNICRKLNFGSPQKRKTNDNPILQEGSSSELTEGVSGLRLYEGSHQSLDDDACDQAFTSEKKSATSQVADPPGISVTKVSSDVEAESAVATEESLSSADLETFISPSKDSKGIFSPCKRKAEGLENALISESPSKDAILPEGSGEGLLKRPVKKGRLSSSELYPDETKEKRVSITPAKDDRTVQKEQKALGFLSPPSHSFRDKTSPSKRKAEEHNIEPETHSPGISQSPSKDTAKRTKLKLPAEIVKQPDSDENRKSN